MAAPAIPGGFARDVCAGLSKSGQKELPSKYLYDEIGSALFEVITLLPEYGLTRADERLLRRHAPEIAACLEAPIAVAELGSGSGRKTRPILEALLRRGRVAYFPIDISAAALARCRQELAGLGAVSIVGLENSYLDGLAHVAAERRPEQSLLVLFLGSTIGNFDRGPADVFLRAIRGLLQPGDALLLGADLEKPVPRLLSAYDDPAGVTAAFNLNLLARINRELGADFDLGGFVHEARWNADERRVEMHLRSLRAQTVSVPAAQLEVAFDPDETIHTESCHKFSREEIGLLAERAGFHCERQWTDPEWLFSESLWVAAEA